MLDLDTLRDDPDRVRQSMQAKRIGDPATVDRALDLDQRRRQSVTELNGLQQQQGELGRQIGPLMKAGQRDQAAPLVERSNEIKAQVKELDEHVRQLEADLRAAMLEIPNTLHPSVPIGGEEDNRLEFEWGDKPSFDFDPLPHWELAERHGLVDFERGAKVTGAGFPFYVGKGARLQRALISLFLDLAGEAGYTEVQAPILVNEASAEGTGQLPDKEGQMYDTTTPERETEWTPQQEAAFGIFQAALSEKNSSFLETKAIPGLSDSDIFSGSIKQRQREGFKALLGSIQPRQTLYLVPTAEVPLTNLHRDEILEPDALPTRYCGYTPCFRREAGSYGKDVRGLNRLHQFDKVELVRFCRPEESYDHLEALLADAERAVQALELPYRRLTLASGDLGVTQAKTYDLEVWSAGQKRWLEVSSVSNFEAFQARRANVRYRPEPGAKPEFVHTLNGSGLALPRIVAALLENNQQADGSVVLPPRLAAAAGFDRIG